MKKFEIEVPAYLSMAVEAETQEEAVVIAQQLASELELGPPQTMNYRSGGATVRSIAVALLTEDNEPDVYSIAA
jgi:hypothetical protein